MAAPRQSPQFPDEGQSRERRRARDSEPRSSRRPCEVTPPDQPASAHIRSERWRGKSLAVLDPRVPSQPCYRNRMVRKTLKMLVVALVAAFTMSSMAEAAAPKKTRHRAKHSSRVSSGAPAQT